jgi:hypothetical protein
MTDQSFQSYKHLIKRAAIHSQQFRHSRFSSRDLSDNEVEEIGFQLVTLFEELFEKRSMGGGGLAPPKKGTPPKPDSSKRGQVNFRSHPYR